MTRWRSFPKGSSESKYHARKVMQDGEVFDSIKERNRYNELLLLEKAGEISGLKRQVKYLLIPEYREPDTTGPRGGIHKGKVIERAVYYIADFVYFVPDNSGGEWVVEDTKGVRTPDYILKRKLMFDRHGIRIRET